MDRGEPIGLTFSMAFLSNDWTGELYSASEAGEHVGPSRSVGSGAIFEKGNIQAMSSSL